MSQELLDSFIDLPALQSQEAAYIQILKNIRVEFEALAGAKLDLGFSKSFKDTAESVKQVSVATEGLKKTTVDLDLAATRAANARKAEAAARLQELKLEQAQTQAIEQQQRKAAQDRASAEKKASIDAANAGKERILQLKQEQAAQEQIAAAEEQRAAAEKARLGGTGSFTGQTNQSSSAIPVAVESVQPEINQMEQLAIAVGSTKESLAGLVVAQKELDLAFEQGTIKQNEYALSSARNLLSQTELKATLSVQQKELQQLVAAENAATGSIVEQRAALQLLNAEYILLSETEKASVEGVALKDKIAANTIALKEEEAALGNSTRNVGNYGSAFDKVGTQLNKFTNLSTIAATTISRLFRTFVGFFIISEILELFRGLGTAIGEAFEKMIAPLGSLNDTLKKNADAIAGTKSTYEAAVQNVDTLREHVRLSKEGFIEQDKVVKEYNDTMGKTTGTVNDLAAVEDQLTKNGENYIKFTLYKAAATVALGKAAEQAFIAEEARQKQAKEFASIGTAAAGGVTAFDDLGNAAPGAADETLKRQEKAAEERKARAIKDAQDQQAALEKIAKDFNDKAKGFKLNFLPDEDTEGKNTKLKTFLSKTSDELIKYQIGLEKELSNAVELGEATRLAFRKDAQERQIKLDIKDRDEKLAIERSKLNDVLGNSKSKDREKENAQREYNAHSATINSEFYTHQKVELLKYEQEIFNIQLSERAKQIEADKQANDIAEEIFKQQHDAKLKKREDDIRHRNDNSTVAFDAELASNNALYAKGVIDKDEFEKRKFDIEKKYSIKSQTNLINDAQFLIDHYKEYGADVIDQEKTIAEIRKKISDDVTQHAIDNAKKLEDLQKRVAGEVVGAIGTLVDDGYDKQKNAIQDQINALDLQRQKEIENVNASVASQQDKAAQIAIINARADSQQKQLEKRQQDADVKKAQFDKIIAEIQIATQTQQAVQGLTLKAAEARAEGALLAANPLTASYAPAAYASAASIAAQIPLVIAEGIISAALVAAKPIPRYKTGVTNAPGGLSVVGDGGVSEIIETPSGLYVTPNKDTLVDLPSGSNVYSDINKFLYKNYGPNKSTATGNEDVVRQLRSLERAVNSKTEHHTKGTYLGLVQSQRTGSRWVTYVDKQIRW